MGWTDAEKLQLKQDVTQARGQFGPWHEGLLRFHPDLLKRVHQFVKAAEGDAVVPEKLRHLIWLAADAAVTHLYPRGIGIHARRALEHGATREELIEALEIACVVTARSYEIGLPILMEELAAANAVDTPPAQPLTKAQAAVRARFIDATGGCPDWIDTAFRMAPDYTAMLLELAYGQPEGGALDSKSRELIYIGVCACPAVLDADGIRRHIRRAIALGTTAGELREVLQLASGIGIHPLSVGIPAMAEQLEGGAAR